MGTALWTLCVDSAPTVKPTATPPTIPSDSSLKRLQEKAQTLPVIMEEETGTPDPSPKQRPRRSTGRLELKAVVVRRRLKEGFRREGVLPRPGHILPNWLVTMRLRFARGQPALTPSPDMLATLQEVPEEANEDLFRLPKLARRLQPQSPDLPRLRDHLQGRRTTTPALYDLPKPKRPSPDSLNSSLRTKRRDVSHSLDLSVQPRTTMEGLAAVYLPKQKRWQTEPGRRKLRAEELQLAISDLQEKSRMLLLRLQQSLAS